MGPSNLRLVAYLLFRRQPRSAPHWNEAARVRRPRITGYCNRGMYVGTGGLSPAAVSPSPTNRGGSLAPCRFSRASYGYASARPPTSRTRGYAPPGE